MWTVAISWEPEFARSKVDLHVSENPIHQDLNTREEKAW